MGSYRYFGIDGGLTVIENGITYEVMDLRTFSVILGFTRGEKKVYLFFDL